MNKTNSLKAVVKKVIVFLIVILQPILVFPFVVQLNASRAQAPPPTPLMFSTATPEGEFGIPTSGENTPEGTPSPQAAEIIAAETESPLIGAACIPGTWQIDHDSVLNYIAQSMTARGVTTFTPLSVTGKMELQIGEGQINAVAEDFKIRFGLNLIGISNLSEFDVIVDSAGNSSYDASDIYMTLTDMTYDVQGMMEYAFASFSMDLNELLEIANSLGFAKNSPMVTTIGLESNCNQDVMTIAINQYASVIFRRVEP